MDFLLNRRLRQYKVNYYPSISCPFIKRFLMIIICRPSSISKTQLPIQVSNIESSASCHTFLINPYSSINQTSFFLFSLTFYLQCSCPIHSSATTVHLYRVAHPSVQCLVTLVLSFMWEAVKDRRARIMCHTITTMASPPTTAILLQSSPSRPSSTLKNPHRHHRWYIIKTFPSCTEKSQSRSIKISHLCSEPE